MALPKSCRMPDLSHLETLLPNLFTAVLGAEGKFLTKRERCIVRVFATLTEKARISYYRARELLLAEIEEMKRTSEEIQKNGRYFYFVDFDYHMENCLNAVRRLYWLLDFVKGEHGGIRINRTLKRRINAHRDKIANIRGAVEHLEKEIRKKDDVSPIMLMVSEDDKSVIIAGYSLEFENLAQLLTDFHTMAKQWLDDFCRELGQKR